MAVETNKASLSPDTQPGETPSGDAKQPTGELVFRVTRGERRGEVIRIRASKCTIGSARRATLRLRSRRIRPIHCLLVRGRGGVLVRSWAADTRLNDQAFDDAWLQTGDRLAIGPLEFEWLGDHSGPRPESEQADGGHIARLEAQLEQLESQLATHHDRESKEEELADAWESRLKQHIEARQQAERSWQKERATLLKKLAQVEEQLEEVDGDSAAQRVAETRTEELERELMEQRSSWKAEIERIQTALTEARTELQQARNLVVVDPEQIEAERSQHREAVQQWHRDRQYLEAQLAERTAELAAVRQELATVREDADVSMTLREKLAEQQQALEHVRVEHREAHAQWQNDREYLEAQLAERGKALESATGERDALRDELAEATEAAESALEARTEQLRQECLTLRDAQSQQQESIAQAEQEVAGLREQLAQAEQSRQQFERQFTESRAEADRERGRREELDAESQQTTARLTELVQEKESALTVALESLRQKNDEWAALRADLEKRLEQTNATVAERDSLAARQEGEKHQLRQRLEALETTLNELRSNQVATTRAMHDEEAARDSVEQMRAELLTARREHRLARDEWHHDRKQLEERLAENCRQSELQRKKLMAALEQAVAELQQARASRPADAVQTVVLTRRPAATEPVTQQPTVPIQELERPPINPGAVTEPFEPPADDAEERERYMKQLVERVGRSVQEDEAAAVSEADVDPAGAEDAEAGNRKRTWWGLFGS